MYFNLKALLAALSLTAAMGVHDAFAVNWTTPTSSEETITVSSSAIGVSTNVCTDGTNRKPAVIQVKGNDIYFTLHSSSATPDSGDFAGTAGVILRLSGPEVAKLRMIRQSSDATVKVQCYDN